VDVSDAASSPSIERCWLTLLGGIVSVVFKLETRGYQMLGFKSKCLNPKHEIQE
jgi:hypothetical protein